VQGGQLLCCPLPLTQSLQSVVHGDEEEVELGEGRGRGASKLSVRVILTYENSPALHTS